MLHHFDFVGDFRAAQHGDERPVGIRNGFAEIRQLFFHQQTGRSLSHELRDAHHRRMRSMRGAKRIAHEHSIAQVGKLLRKSGIVGLFLRMETHIFEQQHFPIAQRFRFRFSFRTHAIGDKRYRLAKQFLQARCHRRKAVLRVHFAFGPSEMRGENQASAAAHRQLQRRQRLADARVVAHFAAVQRHVEIHADENALALQVEVANRKFVHGDDLAQQSEAAWQRKHPPPECAYSFAAKNLIKSRQRLE